MGSKVPTLKGTEVSLSYVQCFLYLVSSAVNVSSFHITWLDTFSYYMAGEIYRRSYLPYIHMVKTKEICIQYDL